MNRTTFSVAALVLVLSGCSFGPAYVRPAAPVPANWPASAPVTGKVASLPGWRGFFTEPRLQALISLALEHNRDLRIATARVAEARAQYGIQSADRLPNVDLAASRYASLTPADISGTGSPLHTQVYSANVNLLSFELDFWGRVRSLNQAALASYLASEEAQRAFRLSLIADVANAYFGLLEMEERVSLVRDTVKSRAETIELTERRRRAGAASDLDYLQAKGALESARVNLANLERSRAAASSLLYLLAGNMPQNLAPGRSLKEQEMAFNVAIGLPSEVLLQRPDVLAAEQRLKAANANIGAARAAFLPRISLTGGFGTASQELSRLFDSGQNAWNFQPLLRLPLFDAGRNEANANLAEARKVIAVAEYEKTIQQAFREVADLLSAREQLALQLATQEASGFTQSERLRLTEARYKGGVSSYLEVLDAQREFFSAQQGAVQTRASLLSATAQLYKALGGGPEGNDRTLKPAATGG